MHHASISEIATTEPTLLSTWRPHPLPVTFDALFDGRLAEQHFRPDEMVLLHDQPADAVLQVVSGTIRCCTLTQCGRRQIFRFAGKGTYLGIADLDRWHYTAEAVDHVIVKRLPRARFERALDESRALRQDLRQLVRADLIAREHHLTSIAFRSAEERLLEFLDTLARSSHGGRFTILPMSRRDIGDHLGLTLETVSRAFSTLKRRRVIEMNGSDRFRLIDSDVAPPRPATAA